MKKALVKKEGIRVVREAGVIWETGANDATLSWGCRQALQAKKVKNEILPEPPKLCGIFDVSVRRPILDFWPAEMYGDKCMLFASTKVWQFAAIAD